MLRFFTRLLWALLAIAAAFAMATIAQSRGEPVNSLWLVVAAVCTYLLGYRFYAGFLAARVMALSDQRATPAERLRDGHDYEPTNKWIVFGHHFAAIAGPAVRLSARRLVDHRRRGARGRRAGFRGPVLLPPPRWQIAGRDGSRRN